MTQVRFKVKTGDTVEVIVGKDKGKRGLISKINLEKQNVLVDGVNIRVRNTKPSAINPQGGRVEKSHPIHVSNVSIVNPSTDKIDRIGVKKNEKGKNQRYFKKTGEFVERISS